MHINHNVLYQSHHILTFFRFQRFQYHDNIVLIGIQEFHTYHIRNLGKDVQNSILTNQNLVKA